MNIRSDNKGLTLIELVVSMMIAAVVLTTIGILYYSSITFYRQVQSYSAVLDDAQIVMLNLGKKIRYASGLVWEDGGRALRIRIDPYYNSSNYLMHKPTLTVDDDIWVRYAWDGDSKVVFDPDYDGPQLPVTIADSISNFTIVAPSLKDDKGIEVSVTAVDASSEKTVTIEDYFVFRYM